MLVEEYCAGKTILSSPQGLIERVSNRNESNEIHTIITIRIQLHVISEPLLPPRELFFLPDFIWLMAVL
jgi:hypothetical protein